MAVTTRTVQGWVGGGLVLAVAVVVGFVAYAHFRAQRFLLGLPGKLGIDIKQETNGFTYSQSVQGKTVFTVHAAKEVQHQNGTVTLHDVGIVLYGRSGDRADRIHGNQFEYDQQSGVMTAVGEVFLDLEAPARAGEAANKDGQARMIHLKTSGLVFRQKERTAETAEQVEFTAGGMRGRSVGGWYDSVRGVVVLRSAVRVDGVKEGRPVLLTAARAELDRLGNVAVLEGARYVSEGGAGAGQATASGGQSLAADHAVVHMTEDATPKRVDGSGHVVLTGNGKGRVSSERIEVELSPTEQPRMAHLVGSVRYVDEALGRRADGQAEEAQVAFDERGRPVHAVMTGGVEMQEKSAGSQRRLRGGRVELAFAGGGKEPLVVRGAEAFGGGGGGAWMRLVDAKDKAGATTAGKFGVTASASTEVTADVLKGRFAARGAVTQLLGLDGTGRTVVEQVSTGSTGAVTSKEVSRGDVLKVEFRPGTKGRTEMTRAEQRGGVTTLREVAKKTEKARTEVEHAHADQAVYEVDADRVTMTGGVEVSDAASALFADRVAMERGSGNGVAEGSVRVSYVQASGQSEPVHVTAARAVGHQGTGVTEFYAGGGVEARLWQGGSQVQAPEIVFDQTRRVVVALSGSRGEGARVKSVLVNSTGHDPAKGGGRTERGTEAKTQAQVVGKVTQGGGGGPVRVASQEMVYTEAARTVEFKGGVVVNDRDGVLLSQQATVFLSAAKAAGSGGGTAALTANVGASEGAASVLLGGRVERMVAQGGVELEQPGRKATGERITYTANDESYVLTGTKGALPRMTDETRGTITGASLRFRSGDDSVVVLGVDDGVGTGRVRSVTRMKP